MKSAIQFKRVQKDEVVELILEEKRQNPRATNKELSIKLRCHRNTISKYVNYIRHNYVKSPEEIVNRIDQKLEEQLDSMTVHELLSYRGQLIPRNQDTTTTEQIDGYVLEWLEYETKNSDNSLPAP